MRGPLGGLKKFFLHSSACLIIVLCAPLAACGDEVIYRRYATQAAAVAAGEQERGWLPEWVPSTASDLHLESDLDSNEWWLRFHLPVFARDSLQSELESIDVAHVRVSKPWQRGWWFEGLIQKEPANDGALNADFFRRCCDALKRTIVLAFDRTTPTVYVWTQR
jgi:hypothetical protein